MSGKSTKLTPEQFDALSSAFKGPQAERNILMCAIGYYSGHRIAEICALTIGDVTDGEGRVNGRIIAKRKTMKGSRRGRSTPIHPTLHKLLTAYIESRGDVAPDAPLLPSATGGHLRPECASRIFKNAARRAGLGNSVSTHSLRKSFAANVLRGAGNNVMIVKEALGHSSITTTMRYLSCDQDEVDRAILAIE